MKKYLNTKSDFLRNVLTLLTGTTIAQAIPILISPILTRIFTPEEFGTLALYIALVSLVAVISTGRYELAIMLPKKDEDGASIVVLSIIIAFLLCGLLLIPFLILSPEIASALGSKKIEVWLYLVPFSIFSISVFKTLTYWTNRKKRYKVMSQNKVTKSAVTGLNQVSMGLAKTGAAGLIVGSFLGQLLVTFMLVKRTWNVDKQKFKAQNKLKIIALAKRYKNFPIINSWSALLNNASLQSPVILLSLSYSSGITGFFSLSQKILQMPMTLIGSAISEVYFEKASRHKDNKLEIRRITLEIYKKLVLLGFLPSSIILLFGEELFAFVFGESWAVAGQYSQLLSIWIYLLFISSPVSKLMTIYEKHIELFIFNLILFISRVSTLLIGWWIIQDAYITIAVYGVVCSIIWFILLIYLMNLAFIKTLHTLKYLFLPLLLLVLLLAKSQNLIL